jgi:hypothetical protein
VAAHYPKSEADLWGMTKLEVLIGYDKAKFGTVRAGPVAEHLVEVWLAGERRVETKRFADCTIGELEAARKHAQHPESPVPQPNPLPVPAPVPAAQEKAELPRKWLWVFGAGVASWLAGWILPGKASDGATGLGELAMLFGAAGLGWSLYVNRDAWGKWMDDGSSDAWAKDADEKTHVFWVRHRVKIIAAVAVFLALAGLKVVLQWRANPPRSFGELMLR